MSIDKCAYELKIDNQLMSDLASYEAIASQLDEDNLDYTESIITLLHVVSGALLEIENIYSNHQQIQNALFTVMNDDRMPEQNKPSLENALRNIVKLQLFFEINDMPLRKIFDTYTKLVDAQNPPQKFVDKCVKDLPKHIKVIEGKLKKLNAKAKKSLTEI